MEKTEHTGKAERTEKILYEVDHASASSCDREPDYSEYLQLEEFYQANTKELNSLLRKLDLRLIPYLGMCYLWCSIDKSNAGNAKLFGFLTDTGMTPQQFNLALTVFFFTYGAAEPFANLFLRRFGPRAVIPTMMVIWGVISMSTTWVRNFHEYIVVRIFLGVFESIIYPGAYFVLSCYYTRSEITKRMGAFYGFNCLGGAFSGVLAYGIHNLNGINGWASWKWIFFIEGIITIGVALTGYLILPNFPSMIKRTFPLSEKESTYIYLRQKYSSGVVATAEEFKMRDVIKAIKDPQVFFYSLMFWFGGSIPTYSLSYTLPTMVKNLGYTAVKAQALSTPPYIAATILTVFMAWVADKSKKRALPIMVCYTIGLVGIIILWISVHHKNVPGLSYFAIFLAASGYNAQAAILGSWCASNIPNPTKRAAAIGIYMVLGSIGGGGIGSNIYLQRQAPYYPLGFGFSVGATVLGARIPCVTLAWYLKRQNRSKELATSLEGIEQFTEPEIADQGDAAPSFRYII